MEQKTKFTVSEARDWLADRGIKLSKARLHVLIDKYELKHELRPGRSRSGYYKVLPLSELERFAAIDRPAGATKAIAY